MSRLSEEEIQAIMEEYKDVPMVNPDKIYPPLPEMVKLFCNTYKEKF